MDTSFLGLGKYNRPLWLPQDNYYRQKPVARLVLGNGLFSVHVCMCTCVHTHTLFFKSRETAKRHREREPYFSVGRVTAPAPFVFGWSVTKAGLTGVEKLKEN